MMISEGISTVSEDCEHTCDDLLGSDLEVEAPSTVTAAINCDLFEGLNQPSGALQIRDELFCSAAAAVGKLDEQCAPHLARGYLV
jgi:hypothetical protein